MHPLHVDSLSGLSVDSAQFRQRASHVQLSDDPDTATQQTVQEMCRQIHQAAQDPVVQQAAQRAVQMFSGGPQSFGTPDACWFWCKHNLRFKHHGSMFEAWSSDLGDPRTKLQLLIAPDVLLRMSSMEGDCAIYTMMICAMLEALGIQWDIVTAAVDARQPEIFGHVWPRAILPGDAREPLDASHGKYPGWQVPAYDLHRVWIFNSSGQQVNGSVAARFTGLHAYRVQPRRRGFGDVQCYEDGTCEDVSASTNTAPDYTSTDLGGVVVPQGGSVTFGTFTDSSGQTYTNATTAPAQSSTSQWAAFATAMGKAGMTLAQINAIQPGTVVSANGSILRQSTGYAVPGTTLTSTLSGMSTTTLLVGGLILVGVFMMMGRK